jgi:hypothetical protein
MQQLHRAPLEREAAMTDKERPKEHAERIEIRPVILRDGLGRASLLRGEVAHRLLDLALLALGQLARLDDEAAGPAEALEGDGAVAKVGEADGPRVHVDVERIGPDLAVDEAGLVERLEGVRRAHGELEERREVDGIARRG